MAIIVELLTGNRVAKHYVIDKLPATVGRSYQCDIHIDDAYVDPEHLAFAEGEDGSITIADLGSRNGSKVNGDKIEQAELNDNDKVTIGKSELRVFSADKELAPALPLSALDEKLSILGTIKAASILCVLYCCLYISQIYLTSFVEFKLSNHISGIVRALLTLSVWPLFFALLSRINKYESRLSSQYSLIWIFAILSMALGVLGRIIEFNFESSEVWFWLQQILKLSLFGALAWLSLLIAFHQSHKRRTRIAIAMTVVVGLAGYGLIAVKDDKFSFKPRYKMALMPPQYQFNQFQDVDQFLDKTDGLFIQANKDKDSE